eukprot:scaffold5060_cov123-Isochrysis_galbana.AAC.9
MPLPSHPPRSALGCHVPQSNPAATRLGEEYVDCTRQPAAGPSSQLLSSDTLRLSRCAICITSCRERRCCSEKH